MLTIVAFPFTVEDSGPTYNSQDTARSPEYPFVRR
jgi:hypothetical protein